MLGNFADANPIVMKNFVFMATTMLYASGAWAYGVPYPAEVFLEMYPKQPSGECPQGKKVVSEACDSKSARAANMVHFRLDAAKKARANGKRKVCAKSAHAALALAAGARGFREKLKKEHEWATGVHDALGRRPF